jgi:hypothetical protein
MNHIDLEAELYALGMLEDAERGRIDAHIAACTACAVLMGQAEGVVATLIDSTQRRHPERRPNRWLMATAAAFAIATAGLLGQNVVLHGALSGDGALLATMVNSHFNHMQFETAAGVEIPAKAIYERHGRWYEILAAGTPEWRVVFVRPDGSRDPAGVQFAHRGVASIAYVTPVGTVRSIDLEDADGHVVGSVHPAVEAEGEASLPETAAALALRPARGPLASTR